MVTQWCPMCLCMVHHYLQHQTDCMLISQIRFPTSLSRKPKSISMISITLGPEFLISEFLIHIEFQWMASTSCTKPIGGEMLIVPLQKWDSSSLFLAVYKWFQPTVNQSLSARVCGLAGMQRSDPSPVYESWFSILMLRWILSGPVMLTPWFQFPVVLLSPRYFFLLVFS